MNKFNLSNYKKTNIQEEYPDWVLSGPDVLKKFYDALNELKDEIVERIESDPSSIESVRERTIVKTYVADKAGEDKTYIRKSRFPKDFFDLIKEYDDQLTNLWNEKSIGLKGGKSKTKNDYIEENEKLKVQKQKLEQENFHDYFNAVMESEVLEEQRTLAKANKQLKIDYEEAQETIANLRIKNNDLLKQLNSRN